MFFEPAHTYMPTPVTPFNAPYVLATAALTMVVGDSGQADQITDDAGRTFFSSSSVGVPRRWSDIQQGAQRVPNIAPLMFTDNEGERPAQAWFGFGQGATHTYDISPKAGVAPGTPVVAAFNSGKISSRFTIPAAPGLFDSITAHNVNGFSPAVSLKMAPLAGSRPVTWLLTGHEKFRWLEFGNMAMSTSQAIRMRTENAMHKVFINNQGPQTSATLRFQAGPGATPVNLGVRTDPARRQRHRVPAAAHDQRGRLPIVRQ